MTILDKIVEKKRAEVAAVKRNGLKAPPFEPDKKRGFKNALVDSAGISIIAEVKKASPSKGLLCPDFDPVRIARDYEDAGASAVSVLTDEKFFQGSLDYLFKVRSTIMLPVLRKDFLIDHIQVEEADLWGADAILLIVSVLDESLLKELLEHARKRGMDVLVEVHNDDEANAAIEAGADLIGINNRNLKDFSVSLDTSVMVRQMIPPDIPVVSESGIRTREDIERLEKNNISAVLIGESLVTAANRKAKLQELLHGPTRQKNQQTR